MNITTSAAIDAQDCNGPTLPLAPDAIKDAIANLANAHVDYNVDHGFLKICYVTGLFSKPNKV